MDDKVISAYQHCLMGASGDTVMDDLKRLCRINETMIGDKIPTDREILVHATLRDVFEYINAMVEYQGE